MRKLLAICFLLGMAYGHMPVHAQPVPAANTARQALAPAGSAQDYGLVFGILMAFGFVLLLAAVALVLLLKLVASDAATIEERK